MENNEYLVALWPRLPSSGCSSSLTEAKYRLHKIRELQYEVECHREFLRKALEEMEDAISDGWTAEEIALALEDNNKEAARTHLQAAKRRQRSWRSPMHGLVPVNDILKNLVNGKQRAS